jgi:hypothetical protein
LKSIPESYIGYGQTFPKTYGDKIPIHSEPTDASKTIAMCSNHSLHAENLLFVPSLDAKGNPIESRTGDWIPVACDGPECYVAGSPNNDCAEENRSKLPSCPHGWARWRDAAGYLQLFPKETPNRCAD